MDVEISPEGILIFQVQPSTCEKTRYIVAVDCSGSTALLTALNGVGQARAFYDWMNTFFVRLSVLACDTLCGGVVVASFTGDGFVVLCETPKAVFSMLCEASPAMVQLLAEAATKAIEKARAAGADERALSDVVSALSAVRLRTAVTHGNVWELEIGVLRNVHQADVERLLADGYEELDSALTQKLESGMAPDRSYRAHMGPQVVLACRLLDTELSRDRYWRVIHESAYDLLSQAPEAATQLMGHEQETIRPRGFADQRVWCYGTYAWCYPLARPDQDQPNAGSAKCPDGEN